MPRTPVSLNLTDVSTAAKLLVKEIAALGRSPGHVEMLNLLARAGGYRNYQHLKARGGVAPMDTAGTKSAAAPVHAAVEAALACFDETGVLVRWANRKSIQALCLWGLWARLPVNPGWSEREINQALNRLHSFGDPAMLRRELVGAGLMSRTIDCRDYRRIDRSPPADGAELIRGLARRWG